MISNLRNQVDGLFSPTAAENEKGIGKTDFSWWKFLLLVLLTCLVLFLRRPDGLLNPQLFAEDGTIFFKSAFELSSWQAIFTPYAGYLHLIPRIIAEFGSLFPISMIPVVYNTISLVIAGVCLSWFYLPNFRHIVKKDSLRLIWVLLMAFATNHATIICLCDIQWYLLAWAMLVTIMKPPENKWLRGLILFGLLLTFCSAPITIVLLPIWLLRSIFAKNPKEKTIASGILVLGITAFIFCLTMGDMNNGISWQKALSFSMIHNLVVGFLVRIVSVSLLGPDLTYKVIEFGRPLFGLAMIIVLPGLMALLFKNNTKLFLNFILLYIAIVSLLLIVVVRLPSDFYFINGGLIFNGGRYFFLGTAALYLFILVCFDNMVIGTTLRDAKNKVGAVALVMVVLLSIPNFKLPPFPDLEWKKYSHLIVATQEGLGTNQQTTLEIPINPSGWSISLYIQN
jgi:hypothetical protein